MTTKSKPAASPSLAGWQARSLHTITCPSGQRLRIRLLGIGTLLEHGDLADDLLEFAMLELTTKGGATAKLAEELSSEEVAAKPEARAEALERVRRYGEFQRHLVCAAVAEIEVEPDKWQRLELAPADVLSGLLPEDDLALVSEIVQRLRAYDARGVRIGVEPLDRWAMFREAHGCPDPTCEGCQKVVAALSSVDVGDL